MKYALIALALLFSGAAQAQQACPYAAAGQTSGVIPVSQTIVINATYGQVIDCSAFQFTATAAIGPMFAITAPNSEAVIKLGIIEGSWVAGTGVDLSNFMLNTLEITALQNLTGTGLYAHNGALAVFDNKITIGAIRGTLGNGFLAQDPSNNQTYGFQGNHVEIGQIIYSHASGIALFAGAIANTFILGPVEHNTVYGCADLASPSLPANLKNVWIVNGSNSNGFSAKSNIYAAC